MKFRAEKEESGKVTPILDFATSFLSDLDHIKENSSLNFVFKIS